MIDNPQQIWDNVLKEIKKEVSTGNYISWIKQTSLISIDTNTATIGAPSIMIISILQKRFEDILKLHLKKLTGLELNLLFVVKASEKTEESIKDGPLFIEPIIKKPLTIGHLPRVRQDFTFQNFAVSGGNQLAFVSSQTVASSPGTSYNPFFIYGPVGVGKTHLMHAIANDVYLKEPDKKIIYITSEEFTNEVVEAIKNNETGKMKRRFRSALLLLIDDIQFIAGKERVQEELFHTFNILIDQGSQIVLSSDRPPHEIKKLEKRLSSRFSGGLTVDIESPDFELKTAILLIKAQKFGVDLPMEVAKLLAENVADARTLEGLLLQVITKSKTQNIPITTALAENALGKSQDEANGHLHAEDVLKAICDYYRVKPTLIKGPKRSAGLVRARQIAMYLLYDKLKLTYVEVGNFLGGRDHTTIIHGVDKIKKLVDSKGIIVNDIMGISNALNR